MGKVELLQHQKDAIEKLKKLKVGALFMEQGTGKSLVALELFRRRLEKGKVEKAIWLSPCSAKENIKNEILKHVPDEMLGNFVICGIETLSTSIRANSYLYQLTSEKKCFLIVDESLMVKNPEALRTKNIIRISEQCEYRLILNGTPISRDESDLYSQFYILDWRILGYKSFWSFKANHLEYDEYGNVRKVLNTEYLARKMKPYVYQIRKKECLTLPPKKYDIQYLYMTEEQEEYYDYIANKLLMEVDEFQPETIYRLFAALQAIISGKKLRFYRVDEYEHFDMDSDLFPDCLDNPRIQTLLNVLPEEKCIIFCNYRHEIDSIMNLLNEEAVRFDGSVSIKKRNQNLQLFREHKKYLVANRECAGYSLNLQFCRNIVYYSNNWNLATRLQSEDRVHRLGQEKDINIIDLVAAYSLDKRISDSLQRKENLLESIKDEIAAAKNEKGRMSEILYVGNECRKYRKTVTIYDCSDLEEENFG